MSDGDSPVYVTMDDLKRHLAPLLKDKTVEINGALLVNIAQGRFLLFESQDIEGGGKNPVWLDWRVRCVWTGSLPSGSTFYKFSHPVATWTANTFAMQQYPYDGAARQLDYQWPTEVRGHDVLSHALQNFKHTQKSFAQASRYFMSVGTRLEDTAIRYYVRNYVSDGFAVEECLRTVRYSGDDSERMQGGSPDLLLVIKDADGNPKFVSGEVKCAANCGDAACKKRRVALATALRQLLSDSDFRQLYHQYCENVKQGDPFGGAEGRNLRAQVTRLCNARRRKLVEFRRTDRITLNLKEALELGKLDYVVYCTDDTHKVPHAAIKPYYVPQMQLEMYHQCTDEARMICYGKHESGGEMNAFGIYFDMACLVATAVYMQTERELAQYAADAADKFDSESKLGDDAFPEQKFMLDLLRRPTFNRMQQRLHQNQELMSRLSHRACLGGSTKDKCDFWNPFSRVWNALDDVAKKVLSRAWVETPLNLFDSSRKRKRAFASVYKTIKQAWSPPADKVRELDFKRPDPKWLRPLTLKQLVRTYHWFCKSFKEACDEMGRRETPPPLYKVASLLAPEGWITETMVLDPGTKTPAPRVFVPTEKDRRTPALKNARWQFDAATSSTIDPDELRFKTVFANAVQDGDWCACPFRRRVAYQNKYKTIAPLAMGMFEDDDNFSMNYHGDEDDWLPLSPDLIPSKTRVRFVVQDVQSFKGMCWATITRVLVDREWDAVPDAVPDMVPDASRRPSRRPDPDCLACAGTGEAYDADSDDEGCPECMGSSA